MNEMEARLHTELECKKENTFLYQIHEMGIWNIPAFRAFINSCFSLLYFYESYGKTAYTQELLRTMMDCFIYMSSLIYCYYSSTDLFTVVNWSKRMEEEIINEFYESFREISQRIFSLQDM